MIFCSLFSNTLYKYFLNNNKSILFSFIGKPWQSFDNEEDEKEYDEEDYEEMYENSVINEISHEYDFIENLNGYNLINDDNDREEEIFDKCDKKSKKIQTF